MEIVVFILLAGVWALFLVPSFFNSRREAPIQSTQDFARDAARLNAVRVHAAEPAFIHRRRVLARRRRALLGLTALAIATLGAAIWTGSLVLLGTNLVADLLLASYIGVLVQIKQQAAAMPAVPLYAPTHVTAEQAAVRILSA